MTDELFDIFFSGKVLPDNDLDTVKQNVGKIFNANASVLAQLFSGKAVKIKKAVDMDTAIKYRVKFREAGAVVDIRPSAAATPTTSSQPVSATATAAAAEPAPPAEKPAEPTQARAAISPAALETSLAAVGSMIDDTPEAPPAQFNTDEFELGPANQGSLEEFSEIVEPAVIPDISALHVLDADGPLDDTPPPPPLDVDTSGMMIDSFADVLDDSVPPPPANIDTSELSVAAPNTGSLEEFDSRPAPVPLPDISKLEIEK